MPANARLARSGLVRYFHCATDNFASSHRFETGPPVPPVHAVKHAPPGEPNFVGDSAAAQLLRAAIDRVARGDAKVLVTGESGVGKDVVTRCLHAGSGRSDRPFVAVNCAAFSESLLESELFGHVRCSFTVAYRDKIGKFQLAHTGTIFLDEVAEMNLRMQALLRFL